MYICVYSCVYVRVCTCACDYLCMFLFSGEREGVKLMMTFNEGDFLSKVPQDRWKKGVKSFEF